MQTIWERVLFLPAPSAVRYPLEIHRVSVWCAPGATLGGQFHLGVVPYLGGGTYTTTAIAHDAAAMEVDSDGGGQALLGSSMQAKLQALPYVGAVTVRRAANTGLPATGFNWLITFHSLPGTVHRVEIVKSRGGSTASTQTGTQSRNNAWLTGEGALAAATRVQKGSAFSLSFQYQQGRTLAGEKGTTLVQETRGFVVTTAT